jgi:hypothetical protein
MAIAVNCLVIEAKSKTVLEAIGRLGSRFAKPQR